MSNSPGGKRIQDKDKDKDKEKKTVPSIDKPRHCRGESVV